MKRALKILLAILIIGVVGIVGLGWWMSEDRPVGTTGAKAEALADSILQALHYDAYQDLSEITWSYPGGHHYVWNKKENIVEVKWDDIVVNLRTKTQTGDAFQDGKVLEGEDLKDAIKTAWQYFANDSFWLVAPFKIRDPGTERSIVETDWGTALLVTYTSGGVTPGDAYLWIVDENYRPVAWKMWVKILPIGGLEISWEGWTEKSDAWFSTTHAGPGGITIRVSDFKVL